MKRIVIALTMSNSLETRIREKLERTNIPGREKDFVVLNIVNGISVRERPEGAHVSFVIEIDPNDTKSAEALRIEAEKAVMAIEGVAKVTAVLTAHKKPVPKKALEEEKLLPGVKKIIAVASGKGGVGKSTVAVNLAVALGMSGKKTGLLDADIYGPSIPRMMGIRDEPRLNEDDKLLPFNRHGIGAMSIGNLIAEDAPVIWRGPMVHGAVRQLLVDVAWGELDILVIDMPPGTGDAPLTLAHLVSLAGVVIVSTPQDIALLDARKAIGMFRKLNVPILGIVENMSAFVCPHCGKQSEIFGSGGARKEAEKLGIRFLGEIPLDATWRETSDAGEPLVRSRPESDHAKVFHDIVKRIYE